MTKSVLYYAVPHAVAAATAATLGVLAMTVIHHVYGAMLFATPWRLHVAYVSAPAALAILAALPLGRASPATLPARIASCVYVAVSGLFAIGAIGFYEGGYNHLLPNLQYLFGTEHTLRKGLYLPPDDLFFQMTGVAQFILAVVAARYLFKVVFPRAMGQRLSEGGAR